MTRLPICPKCGKKKHTLIRTADRAGYTSEAIALLGMDLAGFRCASCLLKGEDYQVVLDQVRWCLRRIREETALARATDNLTKKLDHYDILVSDVDMKLSGLAEWLKIIESSLPPI